MSDAVTLAVVHEETASWSFHDSLNNLTVFDLMHEQRIMRGGYHKVRCGTAALDSARNMAAKAFLESDRSDWLLWVDSDMGFESDSLERLLEVAHPEDRPIVGGLCFIQQETDSDGMSGQKAIARPTIFDWAHGSNGRGFISRMWYEPNAVTKCDGTGSAFVLIHKSVFQKVKDEYGEAWYTRAQGDQGLIAEDLSFCMRAGSVGCDTYIHTGIKTTHFKPLWLGDDTFWSQSVAPPALEQTAVLVPVMKRPQNAEPFMQSLRASTGLAQAYAICDEDDIETRDAWKQAGAHVIQSSGTTFAVKINDGYRATSEPWVFLVGDDVRFLPGWLDHAQLAAGISGASVVGTNDLANPRVTRGEHATHLLIRRQYVDETGFWDGPGQICHEGYGHWFVDDELVTAAKQAGVWSMALASKVEHLHPIFGKGEQDAVYELGQSKAEQDRKVFEARLGKFA